MPQREGNDKFRIQNSVLLYDWEKVWKRKEENMEEGIEKFWREREKDYFFKARVSEQEMEFSGKI